AEFAHIRGRIRLGILHQLGALDGGEQLADFRIGELLVGEGREESHLFAAEPGSLRGHVRLLIPAQHRGAGIEPAEFLAAADEFGISIDSDHGELRRTASVSRLVSCPMWSVYDPGGEMSFEKTAVPHPDDTIVAVS